ncbi:MAG: membrane protein insertase YidC [Rothia sp. (in: high G+C Gram-positive bacteria)]|uniref:membrane protein insertase YidC n=1 Tax=Rothia sp. (in: high G+C Gram-positive bacteria) TaxID=1885016 RepID=UPI0026DF8BF8|nr:membrane protein insertase YidC [Rothia sp. (in: high G+C Gram-positive bacteria)]MDO5749595.1 membrane protein insertase YidC [Rothia sp. (in: high G+C Gram-positive bacteria)]
MNIFDMILWPFKWAVSAVLWVFHTLFTAVGMDPASGLTWVLAIICLTLVMRTITIPLFVTQIKAMRGMSAMQGDMAKLQAKYKGKKDQLSRQQMAQEQMDLYKKHGTNPLASCMPILAQMPIFFGLFQVLNSVPEAASKHEGILVLSADLVQQFNQATIFGANLFATMLNPGNGDQVSTIVQAVVMILIMSGTQFFIQKQLSVKNMSEAALNSPMFRQQQMIMYLFPIIFAVSGINFPLGVLYYWTVSNIWSLGQQWWVIRNNPTPGSQAEKELNARRAAKGLPPVGKTREQHEQELAEARERAAAGQRQQPMSKKRQKQQRSKGKSN